MAMTTAGRHLPAHLAPHVPPQHRLFYAPTRGALRMDWIMCVCGLGIKLDPHEAATDAHWFQAVNQCRLGERLPLVTEEGTFVEPPSLEPASLTPPATPTTKKTPHSTPRKSLKKPAGRPAPTAEVG